MVKVFRHTRQKFLSEGKTNRYLKFALVEILLIMIGILLAFQIDNWNERRKLRLIQNEALVKLNNDLSHDIERYNELDSTYSAWLKEADYILEEVLDGTTPHLNSTKDYTVGRGSMYYITLNNSTYNEMINTGILYEFNNQEISNGIIDYYDSSTFELEKLNSDNHVFFQWTVNYSSPDSYSIIFRLAESRNLEYIDWDWLNDPASPLFKELETKIIYFKAAITANKNVIGNLRNKATIALNAIKDYQQ
jgi:hypothetical protein